MADEVLDRRSAIEEAFNAAEAEAIATAPEPIVSEGAPAGESSPAPDREPATSAADAPTGDSRPAQTPVKPAAASEVVPPATAEWDKPPTAWRGPQREKWSKLDPDVRQEVIRREREIAKTFGENAQVRQFANQFHQAVQPYMPRLQALGANPLKAVSELLKADYLLATGNKAQKAALIAKFISDYDVDVRELDNTLSGQPTTDPVGTQVEQLLAQRLAPFQQYIAQQQQREQASERQTAEQIGQSLEKMAADPKYPHFETLRNDMADAIDLAAKRGLYLSLDAAYTRAVAMNPEVSAQVARQRESETQRASARAAHARAQKALGASVSVGGSPGGVPSGASGATDRRAVIAAAFDAVGGR